jgi:hypothetical protein
MGGAQLDFLNQVNLSLDDRGVRERKRAVNLRWMYRQQHCVLSCLVTAADAAQRIKSERKVAQRRPSWLNTSGLTNITFIHFSFVLVFLGRRRTNLLLATPHKKEKLIKY